MTVLVLGACGGGVDGEGIGWIRATVLTRNNQAASFDVSDLSAGGALLVGELTLAVGEAIRVLLEKESARPLALVARVMRIEPSEVEGRVVAAVAFTSVPEPIQDALQGRTRSIRWWGIGE